MEAGPLIRTKARLDMGEPLRVLIGEKLHDASEIILIPAAEASLRATLSQGLAEQIASLTDPDPAAPACALPSERNA